MVSSLRHSGESFDIRSINCEHAGARDFYIKNSRMEPRNMSDLKEESEIIVHRHCDWPVVSMADSVLDS